MNDLLEQLKKLAYRTHYNCEDSWYSCPLSADGCSNDLAGNECNCWARSNQEMEDLFNKLEEQIKELESSLRWIPVTEQLPPDDGTGVDFLNIGGYDGYGHMYRRDKEWCEKYGIKYDSEPCMLEYDAGPYYIGKNKQGYWGVSHWRLRPGTEPDFDKFIEENK